MADLRKKLHQEIDRMATRELPGLKEFLTTFPDSLCAKLRNTPYDDEPLTDEDRQAMKEAEEWLEQNGGEGMPHDQMMRELGLD